ncbi:MAG TPA: CerR family C-terminal domain-containing protein [Bryobacteraceae bacterium]|jgi:AcrR family transcriptional regulator
MARQAATRKFTEPAQDQTRGKLVLAAAAVFSEKGYERATIREICRRASVNLALVNYHFGDKLELYLEVIRYALDAAAKMEMLNQAVQQNADPCDALRQVIRGMVERLSGGNAQYGLHTRLLLKELARPTPAVARIIKETMRPLYDRLRTLIAQILNLPIDHLTTRLCTHSVIGQASHYFLARPILSQLWPEMKLTPPQREIVAAHIADFSLAYLRAQRRPK